MTTNKKKSPRSGEAGGPKTATKRSIPGEINDTSPATDVVGASDFANVTEDTELDYFSAPNKNTKFWTAGTITWGELIEMARTPADHKECGQYVLGRFNGRSRSKETLRDRCALALDVDAPKPGFLADALLELDGTAAIIHTTYSSTVDMPRYRIIIPLTERVDADTYRATVETVIDRLAPNDKCQFDDGSVQPERYMFKPSTQDPDHYTYQVLEGSPLEPSVPQEDPETSSEDDGFAALAAPASDRPGDLYAAANDWQDILTADGWSHHQDAANGIRFWTKPGGASNPESAKTGLADDVLHVLSTKTTVNGVRLKHIAEDDEGRRGYSKFGYYAAVHHGGNFAAASDALAEQGYVKDDEDSSGGHKPRGARRRGRPSTAEILIDMARSHFRFARGEDGDAFAIGDESPHIAELVGDNSKSPWARKLNRMFLERENRPPNGEALGAAVLTGQGMADSLEPVKVWRRTARNGGDIWIDLGDRDNRVIHLDATGWNLQDTAPVMFRRSGISSAFPVPVDAGQGSLDPLWRHVNATTAQRPLLLAWLINAIIRPDGEQPLLTIDGEKGSGKTFGTRTITALVDPLSVSTLSPPRDDADWVAMTRSRWCVPVDNISSISDRWSDQLARTATGSGEAGRTLYTRSDLSASMMLNPVILNGITFGRIRSDLADRMVLLQLKRIPPEHRLDSEQQRDKWARDYPVILGGLLDLAVQVHRVLDSVPRPPEGVARMTSYAKVLLGVDAVLGTEGYSEYRANAVALARAGIEGDPFMLAILSAITKPWSGTAKELHRKAKNADLLDDDSDGSWTRMTPQGAGRALKRMAGDLREIGWEVEEKYDRKRKLAMWSLEPPS